MSIFPLRDLNFQFDAIRYFLFLTDRKDQDWKMGYVSDRFALETIIEEENLQLDAAYLESDRCPAQFFSRVLHLNRPTDKLTPTDSPNRLASTNTHQQTDIQEWTDTHQQTDTRKWTDTHQQTDHLQWTDTHQQTDMINRQTHQQTETYQ